MESDPLKLQSNRVSNTDDNQLEGSGPFNQRGAAYEVYYNPEEEAKEVPGAEDNADFWNEPIEFLQNDGAADTVAQGRDDASRNDSEILLSKGDHNASVLGEESGDELSDNEDQSENKETTKEKKEDDSEPTCMRYGDRIVLYIDGELKYYLSSDGFATKRLYFREGCSGRKRGEIFIVIPETANNHTTRMKAAIGLWEKRKKDGKSMDASSSATTAKLQKENSIFKQEIPKEISRIWAFQKKKFGEPVRYGDRVQLIHMKTQLFVKVSKKVNLSAKRYVSEVKQTAEPKALKNLLRESRDMLRVYSLKLVPLSSPCTHFIIHHYFNTKYSYQQNERILEQDSFYLAFADTTILEKMFFIYFKPPYMLEHNKKATKKDSRHCMFNSYLYEEEDKSPLKFSPVDEDFVQNHICREINGKTLWITHIEEPYYLCVDTIERRPEFSDSHLNALIDQSCGEARSQRFGLGFVAFNPGESKPTDGLWMLFASKEETGKEKITLKNLYYDVWLKNLQVVKDYRGGEGVHLIKDKSTFKLRSCHDKFKNDIHMYGKGEGGKKKSNRIESESDGATKLDDSQFRIVLASGHEHLLASEIAEIAAFVRRFDIQGAQKKYDFTEGGALWILSRALRTLKLLCLNASPSAIISTEPYQTPFEYTQRVNAIYAFYSRCWDECHITT